MSLDQGPVIGDFLKEELFTPDYCREPVTIASGQNLVAGAVLGKITVGGAYAAFDNDAGTGIETAAGILLYPVDASGGALPGLILARGPAVVSKGGLTWAAANDADDILAGLAELLTLGIVAAAFA